MEPGRRMLVAFDAMGPAAGLPLITGGVRRRAKTNTR